MPSTPTRSPQDTPDWALSSRELRERKSAEAERRAVADPLIGRTLADLPEEEREAAAQRYLDGLGNAATLRHGRAA